MRAHWLFHGGPAVGLIALSACTASGNYLDPYQKPYVWQPTGAPTANLATQLVNPHDLAFGRGAPEGDAKQATLAIEHVWQDRPKPLLTGDSSSSSSSSGASSGAPGATGGGTGGGTGGPN